MKKILKWLGLVIIVFLLVSVIGKNVIVKKMVTGGVKSAVGMDLSIDSLNVGILRSRLAIDGLRIRNPPGFGGGVFLDVPEILVDYVLKSFLEGRADFTEIQLNVKELNMVEDKGGKLNVEAWSKRRKGAEKREGGGEKEGEEEKENKAFEFRVDLLKLRIARATFTDLASGKTEVYDLGIDEEFKDVTGLDDIIRVVMVTALQNNLFRKATGVDLKGLDRLMGAKDAKSLEEGVGGLLDSFWEAAEKRGKSR